MKQPLFLFACCLALLLCCSPANADEFDSMRLKWGAILTGTDDCLTAGQAKKHLEGVERAARGNWQSMNKVPERACLWNDLNRTNASADITEAYRRLNAMALAHAMPGTDLHRNPALSADIIAALDWMNSKRYNATTKPYMNWWDWTIGAPSALANTSVLMYDQLSPAQLQSYMGAVEKHSPWPSPNESHNTGANLLWMAQVTGIRGCLIKEASLIAACRESFSRVFPYVTQGDGFYADGSFIQHQHIPYNLGYGSSLLTTIAPLLQWLQDTPWAVKDPAQTNLYRWISDSIEPFVYRGQRIDTVRGRESGRFSGDSNRPTSLARVLWRISKFAPPADAERIQGTAVEWECSDRRHRGIWIGDANAGRAASKEERELELLYEQKRPRGDEPIGHFVFAAMDRVIHMRPGYRLAISMCSSRIANFESINGENLSGWFTGDGRTLLYNADRMAFTDHYAPTIDPYRLPGVTADVTHPKLPHVPVRTGLHAQGQGTLSPYSWVGGATLGPFGAAGMQFKGAGVSLTGKKSWFMFDNEIVCLGAGITSTDHRPIETTVENRKVPDSFGSSFVVNGTATEPTGGWEQTMPKVQWAHLQAGAPGADIGYYFPEAPTLKITKQTRSGSWQEIHASAPATRHQRTYLRVGFEHGSDPVEAGYQYFLLPCIDQENTRKYAQAPEVTILANDASIQAVRENTLGITAANFWTETGGTAGVITSDKPACVLVRADGMDGMDCIEVAVSDPTQLNADSIELQIALPAAKLFQGDPCVSVSQTSPHIRLSVKVAGSAGRTFTARFARPAP